LGEKVRLKIQPFDWLRVVSEVEPPEAGARRQTWLPPIWAKEFRRFAFSEISFRQTKKRRIV
jgi:hypothetical protein